MIPCSRKHLRLIGALVLLAPFHTAIADTIRVPGDHPTIRAPIDAAAGSDEIIVASGLHNEASEAVLLAGGTPQQRPTRRTREVQSPNTRQPTISQRKMRDIATAAMKRDVKLWHEINAPDWTLGSLYGDDFPFPLPGPANMKLLDHTVEALRAWRNISTSAVITTRRWYIDRVYRRLKRDVPDMRIIPGLKLNEFLPNGADYDFLADRTVWEAFAADALRCAKITGVPQIVIMAEGPMGKFNGVHGRYRPDMSKFRKAMAPLRESGLRVIWYPFGPHTGRPIADGVGLVRAILKAVPNSYFPSVGDGFPVREHDPDQNARRKAQIEATKGRMVHHLFMGPGKGLYVWSNGKSRQAYTIVDFIRWLDDRALGDVWVFSGAFNSKAVGEELQALLLPNGFRIESDIRDLRTPASNRRFRRRR